MFICMPICQPHGLVSRKYLRSSKGHSFCSCKPQDLIFFASFWICFQLNHNPEMGCQPQILAAANFGHLRDVFRGTFGGVIFDYA